MTHGLLVNPQAGYAIDNRCMQDASAQSGGRLKGVDLIGDDVSDTDLDALQAGGIAGARFNLWFAHATSMRGAAGRNLAARIRELAGSPRSTTATTPSSRPCPTCMRRACASWSITVAALTRRKASRRPGSRPCWNRGAAVAPRPSSRARFGARKCRGAGSASPRRRLADAVAGGFRPSPCRYPAWWYGATRADA